MARSGEQPLTLLLPKCASLLAEVAQVAQLVQLAPPPPPPLSPLSPLPAASDGTVALAGEASCIIRFAKARTSSSVMESTTLDTLEGSTSMRMSWLCVEGFSTRTYLSGTKADDRSGSFVGVHATRRSSSLGRLGEPSELQREHECEDLESCEATRARARSVMEGLCGFPVLALLSMARASSRASRHAALAYSSGVGGKTPGLAFRTAPSALP